MADPDLPRPETHGPYLRERRGAGLPVLFVHGNGVDHRSLLPLDAAVARAGGCERWYLDLPGFGRTAALPGAGELTHYANWLDNALRQLFGTQRFALVAHSMGALLAQEVADRLPEQVAGLVLLAPVIYPQISMRNLPEHRIIVENEELMDGLESADRAAYSKQSVIRTEENWERFKCFVLPGLRAANLRAMARLTKNYELTPLPVQREHQQNFPVLAISGQQDHVVGYRDVLDLHRRYRRLTVEVITEAGHNLHIDQPVPVGHLIERWAKQITA